MSSQMTVGSLFSGIGGLDLGLERAGMRVIWQSEIDPYACRVLEKHWPEVVNHGNIKEINWQEVERPDVICGGYPCQPFSTAGKRRGEEDPRHLWPWVREAISQLRPRYAILENVRGHLSMGGLSVIAELATIGYDAEWRVVSAASVGANHRRDRIIIVAYPDNSGNRASGCDIDGDGQALEQGRQVIAQPWSCGCSSTLANSHSNQSTNGRECQALSSESGSRRNDRSGSGSDTGEISLGSSGQVASDMADTDSKRFEKPIRTSQGVFSSRDAWGSGFEFRRINSWWEVEPNVGRVADGVPSRVDRLKGLGNAVVPQVAEVIGRLVVAHGNV
jgi:DNA (cytosine-5)-methyltransferase 1